tara:strand:- start:204 stop:542 length:339 start_codon:yes stop_codon:yes gene_type:complete
MATNYTEEQVSMMVDWYTAEPTRETVDTLAKEFDKSVKSIIGKLSREGVYQKQVYKTKTGEVPMTKADIIMNLSQLLEIDSTKIMGLEKAPKQDIKYLTENVSKILLEAKNG